MLAILCVLVQYIVSGLRILPSHGFPGAFGLRFGCCGGFLVLTSGCAWWLVDVTIVQLGLVLSCRLVDAVVGRFSGFWILALYYSWLLVILDF